MATIHPVQDDLIWAVEFMIDNDRPQTGETLYGFGLRVRNYVERALSSAGSEPSDSEDITDTITDLSVVVEDAKELFTEAERLELPLAEVIRLIPSRLNS